MTEAKKQHPISKYIHDKISNLLEKSTEENVVLDNRTEEKKRTKRKTTTVLAMLRKGIGLPPGSVPEIWDITLENLEELFYKSEDRCAGEFAVHHTLTLFALHQQGKDINKLPMNSTSYKDNFGRACRKLADLKDSNYDSVRNRFNILVKSQTPEMFVYYLRGMIQLLKAKDIQVNYAELGYSLFKFYFRGNRDDLRLKWGEEFFESSNPQNTTCTNESV